MTPAIVHMTLAPDLHDLEPTLTRYGYNVTALAELLNHSSGGRARVSPRPVTAGTDGGVAQPVTGHGYPAA